MGDASQSRHWLMSALYLALCTVLAFLSLLPLETAPRGWAGPDLILALTCAWVVRRPEFVPVTLVALVFLLTGLMFQMPPGLWAALVLIATETLRARATGLRDLTFAAEWVTVAVTLATITLANQVILGVLLVDRPPLGLSLMQLVMTLAAYPLVVLASQFLMGVRKQTPGDVDALMSRK
ncbi:MAG: rod shape-determining protein MreD [Roseovarius sp.]